MDKIELLRDAIAVQEERDRAAALRVGEPPMGCDTSDHLADIILDMRNPWIDVDDRLPDHSGAVLVYFIGDYALGYWFLDDEDWFIEGHGMGFGPTYVTHWCELPKPPGGTKHGGR